MESMNDILSEKEPEQTEVAEVTETPVEVVEDKTGSRRKEHLAKEYEAQGRDPSTGQFVKEEKTEKVEEKPEVKAEVKPEVKKEEFTDKEKAFLRGLEEERRKRQDLERQLAELKKPKEEGEKKTFWDDPEGHFKTVEQRIAQRELAMTLKVSEQLARSKYTDFDDKISVFAEDLRTVPGLHAQWIASQDPAEFAYKHGARVKEMREVGDIEKFKEKIEKETRAKLEAEFKKKQEDLEKQRKELPGSLSDVKGATKQHQPVFTGPTPLKDIFGH